MNHEQLSRRFEKWRYLACVWRYIINYAVYTLYGKYKVRKLVQKFKESAKWVICSVLKMSMEMVKPDLNLLLMINSGLLSLFHSTAKRMAKMPLAMTIKFWMTSSRITLNSLSVQVLNLIPKMNLIMYKRFLKSFYNTIYNVIQA